MRATESAVTDRASMPEQLECLLNECVLGFLRTGSISPIRFETALRQLFGVTGVAGVDAKVIELCKAFKPIHPALVAYMECTDTLTPKNHFKPYLAEAYGLDFYGDEESVSKARKLYWENLQGTTWPQ